MDKLKNVKKCTSLREAKGVCGIVSRIGGNISKVSGKSDDFYGNSLGNGNLQQLRNDSAEITHNSTELIQNSAE